MEALRRFGAAPDHRVVDNSRCKYEVIALACKELNWCTGRRTASILWVDGLVSPAEARSHTVNHFLGMNVIATKCNLANQLNCLRAALPLEFNFHPISFVLPKDRDRLVQYMQRFVGKQGRVFRRALKQGDADFAACPVSEKQPQPLPSLDSHTLILKPDCASRGNGIRLVISAEGLAADENSAAAPAPIGRTLAQVYLPRPLLIDGRKFDLRVYVYVASVWPTLRVFVSRSGLARFAAEGYERPTEDNANQRQMHLTNTAVSGAHAHVGGPPSSVTSKSRTGCKWSMEELFACLRDQGIDVDSLWVQIKDIVAKTILLARPSMVADYVASSQLQQPQQNQTRDLVNARGSKPAGTRVADCHPHGVAPALLQRGETMPQLRLTASSAARSANSAVRLSAEASLASTALTRNRTGTRSTSSSSSSSRAAHSIASARTAAGDKNGRSLSSNRRLASSRSSGSLCLSSHPSPFAPGLEASCTPKLPVGDVSGHGRTQLQGSRTPTSGRGGAAENGAASEGGFRCFELLGFDILLDMSHCRCQGKEQVGLSSARPAQPAQQRRVVGAVATSTMRCQPRPVLLEVNQTPQLQLDSELDVAVKRAVVQDALVLSSLSKEMLLDRFNSICSPSDAGEVIRAGAGSPSIIGSDWSEPATGGPAAAFGVGAGHAASDLAALRLHHLHHRNGAVTKQSVVECCPTTWKEETWAGSTDLEAVLTREEDRLCLLLRRIFEDTNLGVFERVLPAVGSGFEERGLRYAKIAAAVPTPMHAKPLPASSTL